MVCAHVRPRNKNASYIPRQPGGRSSTEPNSDQKEFHQRAEAIRAKSALAPRSHIVKDLACAHPSTPIRTRADPTPFPALPHRPAPAAATGMNSPEPPLTPIKITALAARRRGGFLACVPVPGRLRVPAPSPSGGPGPVARNLGAGRHRRARRRSATERAEAGALSGCAVRGNEGAGRVGCLGALLRRPADRSPCCRSYLGRPVGRFQRAPALMHALILWTSDEIETRVC